jgi:hypothetical protein
MNTMGPSRDASGRGVRRRAIDRIVAFAATLVVAAGMFLAGAAPANAVGTWVHRVCHKLYNLALSPYEWVDYCVGFDYSGVTNGNRLRAYAKIVARGIVGEINDPVIVEFVRLGDGNGIISQTPSYTVGSGSVEVDTPLNYQCHTASTSYYNARAKFGVNWSTGGGAEWEFWVYYWRSVDGVDGACSNNYITYYALKSPYPPGYVAYDELAGFREW